MSVILALAKSSPTAAALLMMFWLGSNTLTHLAEKQIEMQEKTAQVLNAVAQSIGDMHQDIDHVKKVLDDRTPVIERIKEEITKVKS